MNPKWIGLAFGVLLVAAWAGRDVQAPLQPTPRAARPAPPMEEAPKEDSEAGMWTAVAQADRDVILRRTEEFLGLSAEERRAFHSAAVGAIEDVDRAWAVREEGWIAVSSSVHPNPDLETEIQSRYESEKERALQPLVARLQGSERGDRLRERLDEWFDALR
jgi:hypothetical protein